MFDLDGTLLPMDREEFARAYLPQIAAVGAAAGFGDARTLADIILQGSYQMVRDVDPATTCEQVFWRYFTQQTGLSRQMCEQTFAQYYLSDAFEGVCALIPPEPLCVDIVRDAKRSGLSVVLATSPLFPEIAVRKRIEYAGLQAEDFAIMTSYERMHAAKPNAQYYEQLLAMLGLKACQCIMIGNEAQEAIAPPAAMGMRTFYLTDHAINRTGEPVPSTWCGRYADLAAFVRDRQWEHEPI